MIAYLSISTFVDSATVPWACHYNARLRCGDDEETLWSKLTAPQLKKMNKLRYRYQGELPDGTYSVGDEYPAFFSEDAAEQDARAKWKALFPKATILLRGDHCLAEPLKVLAAPRKLKKELLALHEQAEKIGWWDNDEGAMGDIADRWCALLEPFK